MVIRAYQLTVDIELRLDSFDGRIPIPVFRVDVAGGNTQAVQVSRRIRPAMIGLQYDQRVIEADMLVDELEELGERPVKSEDIVLAFEARRAEHVADVIGR